MLLLHKYDRQTDTQNNTDDEFDHDTENSSLISVSEPESGSEVGKTPSTGKKRLKGPKYTQFNPCGFSDTAKQSLPADTVEYVDKKFWKFIDKIIWVMLNLYLISYMLLFIIEFIFCGELN